jgi:hypothetical protein
MWNKVDISEIKRSAKEDCHVIQKHLLGFQSAVVQPNAANEVTREQVFRWPYKLAHDLVKINFDAEVPTRDDGGEFIAAAAGKL